MSKQERIEFALKLWVEESSPYWKKLREMVLDEAVIEIFGMAPRKMAD